jgi:hypothetical protein
MVAPGASNEELAAGFSEMSLRRGDQDDARRATVEPTTHR